jgi:hypothetical protein
MLTFLAAIGSGSCARELPWYPRMYDEEQTLRGMTPYIVSEVPNPWEHAWAHSQVDS